jgi:hypothetical protein
VNLWMNIIQLKKNNQLNEEFKIFKKIIKLLKFPNFRTTNQKMFQGSVIELEIQNQLSQIQVKKNKFLNLQLLEVELVHHIKNNDYTNIEIVEEKIEKCNQNLQLLRSQSDQIFSDVVFEEHIVANKKKKLNIEEYEKKLTSQLEVLRQEIQEEEINQYFKSNSSNQSHFALVMTALKSEEEKLVQELKDLKNMKYF